MLALKHHDNDQNHRKYTGKISKLTPMLLINYFEMLSSTVESWYTNMNESIVIKAMFFDLTGQMCIQRKEIKSFNTFQF